MTLDEQKYLTFGCMFLIICIYTSMVIHSARNPRVYPKRDKSRKHALLRALLEQKRREKEDGESR